MCKSVVELRVCHYFPDKQIFIARTSSVSERCRFLQLWTDIADKDISCFTSDIKEIINEEVNIDVASIVPRVEMWVVWYIQCRQNTITTGRLAISSTCTTYHWQH